MVNPNEGAQEKNNKESDYCRDPITGKEFIVIPEKEIDTIAANITIVYLLFMLAFFLWQLFDFWYQEYTIFEFLGYKNDKNELSSRLSSPAFKLAVYIFIGGGLGGIVNRIRSYNFWHCEKGAFSRRYLGKEIASPWLGATIALFAYALLRSGIVVLGGDLKDTTGVNQVLSFFAIGVLAGYGSYHFFAWLDVQVKKIFKVPPPETTPAVEVPSLLGKSKEEAEKLLKASNLKLGKVNEEPKEETEVGKVIRQKPKPGTLIAKGKSVDITIGSRKVG